MAGKRKPSDGLVTGATIAGVLLLLAILCAWLLDAAKPLVEKSGLLFLIAVALLLFYKWQKR